MKIRIQAAAAVLAAVLLAGCTLPGGAESTAPTPTPQATATPEPTPTPIPADNTNPLTGQTTDANYAGQRPVAVTLRGAGAAAPLWGVASADLLIEGVSDGYETSLTAVFATRDTVSKAGPVGPARDLGLQFVLPLNAVPVHISKNVYAYNLLNVLAYQDVDGLNVGTTGFAFDADRYANAYAEENCWYTTADLVAGGLANYGMDTAGDNMQMFHFAQRPTPTAQNGANLYLTFSESAGAELKYDGASGMYLRHNFDGTPTMDADSGQQASFKNVLVLYAASGVKDDGYTRQYDLSGGTGLYLTDGAWQPIRWTKGDATAPLALTDESGATLDVNPGKTYLAVWGGYYGQAIQLFAADGSEQTLPDKPALLESGVSDEAAAAATQDQKIRDGLLAAQSEYAAAQQAVSDAAATEDTADDAAAADRMAAAQQALDAAQAAYDAAFPQQDASTDAGDAGAAPDA